jgi:choline dehydrogenase-like flavoprotein
MFAKRTDFKGSWRLNQQMKIEKLDLYPPASQFDTDVVVVGGGPAGLTIAREFSNSATKVLVLESGLETENLDHMELNRLESGNEPKGDAAIDFRRAFHGNNMATFNQECQPFGVRCRLLGGSATHWGGKSAVFDNTDFAKRSWVPNSGWPISRASLEPYFERAANVLNLGPNLYDEKLWSLMGRRIKRPPLDNTKLSSVFWQFARSRLRHTEVMNFADEFRASDSKNISALTNATVMRIDLDSTEAIFSGLEVSTLEGVRHYVRAKFCVLAAGGIENARLLLNSNHQHGAGVGNKNDVVGRYLMDHPGTRIGYFKKEDLKAAAYLGFYSVPHKGALIMYTHGLAFSAELQAREKLLNAAIYVLPEIALDDPIEAIKRLGRLKSTNPVADLLSLISSTGLLAKGVGLKIFNSKFTPRVMQKAIVDFFMSINPSFVVREFQSKGVPHKLERMGIHVITEQVPDPDSRLVLSEQNDVLGARRVKALWKISDAERRSAVRIGQLLQEELPKAGMPAPLLDSWITENRPHDGALVDMAHIIGTTRMSDDPKTGVVDNQCKVHGIEGLYVAGSSVFPTSGHANPTLMIIALAIRTADQLKKDLAATHARLNFPESMTRDSVT